MPNSRQTGQRFAQSKNSFGKQEIADHDTGNERHCSLVGDESKLPKILLTVSFASI